MKHDIEGERYRGTLIAAAMQFARRAWMLEGVRRVALIGSIITDKPRPKDVDLLVTIDATTVDLISLAKLGRQLKGGLQSAVNSGADIFLLDLSGKYIGRICRYKECPSATRTTCSADHCGQMPHVCDDLSAIDLGKGPDDLERPAAILFPDLVINAPLPPDLGQAVDLLRISRR